MRKTFAVFLFSSILIGSLLQTGCADSGFSSAPQKKGKAAATPGTNAADGTTGSGTTGDGTTGSGTTGDGTTGSGTTGDGTAGGGTTGGGTAGGGTAGGGAAGGGTAGGGTAGGGAAGGGTAGGGGGEASGGGAGGTASQTWAPASAQLDTRDYDSGNLNQTSIQHTCLPGWAMSRITLNFRGMTGYLQQNGNLYSRCITYIGSPLPPIGSSGRQLSCLGQQNCQLKCNANEVMTGFKIDYGIQQSERGYLWIYCATVDSKYTQINERNIDSGEKEDPGSECDVRNGEALSGVRVKWVKGHVDDGRPRSTGELGIWCSKYKAK